MIANNNHTPGPWAIGLETDDTTAQVINDKGQHVAYVEIDPLPQHARLIAAAPELLAALRGLLQHFHGPQCLAADYPGSFYMAEVEAAQDAIKKATGARDQ